MGVSVDDSQEAVKTLIIMGVVSRPRCAIVTNVVRIRRATVDYREIMVGDSRLCCEQRTILALPLIPPFKRFLDPIKRLSKHGRMV